VAGTGERGLVGAKGRAGDRTSVAKTRKGLTSVRPQTWIYCFKLADYSGVTSTSIFLPSRRMPSVSGLPFL
jgi:hypothetical protein